MNEIMKVLTVISTMFIPVTFIAGVYGMNFKYMPELEWRWSYFGVWAIMLSIEAGLVFFFWRRGWFRSNA
jgi:magnesium transporter